MNSVLELLTPLVSQSTSAHVSAVRCRLLELPAELREQIWIQTVTEWRTPTLLERKNGSATAPMLQRSPIRIDRFNRPPSPAVTQVCRLTRQETMPLYYACNSFECWRPLFWKEDWSQSTFVDWLTGLGAERCWWIENIVLLYKHETELDHDVVEGLAELGIELQPGVIHDKRELTELEMGCEVMGLPRHFGRQGRRNRWLT